MVKAGEDSTCHLLKVSQPWLDATPYTEIILPNIWYVVTVICAKKRQTPVEKTHQYTHVKIGTNSLPIGQM